MVTSQLPSLTPEMEWLLGEAGVLERTCLPHVCGERQVAKNLTSPFLLLRGVLHFGKHFHPVFHLESLGIEKRMNI